jgi:hypothetical protein
MTGRRPVERPGPGARGRPPASLVVFVVLVSKIRGLRLRGAEGEAPIASPRPRAPDSTTKTAKTAKAPSRERVFHSGGRRP